MVNHLRTLLLNDTPDPLVDHEEYIEATFRPLGLNYAAGAIQSLLIRPDWPRSYRNFIATLLAGVVYNSPFQPLVDALDPRTTIDFGVNQVPNLQNTIQLNRLVDNGSNLQVVGIFHSNPDAGIFSSQWVLSQSGSNVVQVENQTTKTVVQVPVTFTGDTTQLYPLSPNNELYFQFIGVTTVPAIRVIVTAQNPMSYDVLEAFQRLRTSINADAIFQSTQDLDVLREMQDVFHNSRRPDHALAAILVAYCYHLAIS